MKSRKGAEITPNTLGPSNLFGEMALIENIHRSATAVVAEDSIQPSEHGPLSEISVWTSARPSYTIRFIYLSLNSILCCRRSTS